MWRWSPCITRYGVVPGRLRSLWSCALRGLVEWPGAAYARFVIGGIRNWPGLPGLGPPSEESDDHYGPIHRLAAIQPAIIDAERLALAGFLVGYRGSAYELAP
jgi:hypothetical protein